MLLRECLLLFLSLSAVSGQFIGAIRLFRNSVTSSTFSSGRIQVYLSEWGNICGDKTTSPFSTLEGDVACRQLGYTGASATTIASDATDSYGADASPILIDQVTCSESDANIVLLQCDYSTLISDVNCNKDDDVGVSCYIFHLWDDPFPGMVRLSNGSYSSEGIVEIFCNGIWSTLCGGSIGTNDANSICLQLGYKGAASISTVSSTLALQWFDSLSCTTASEACIKNCQSCPEAQSPPHSCSNDAYVQCHYIVPDVVGGSNQYECTSDYYPRGEGAIRLARGNLYSLEFNSGRVQVYYNKVWGNVCRLGGFSSTAADVVCHQAGWTGASDWSYSAVDSFPIDVRTSLFDDIQCTDSSLLVLQQCFYSTDVDPQCTDDGDVSVTCYTNHIWDNPFSGMVRLAGTNFVNEGRVEVYCNGEWGTVCSNNFDANDRRAICRQLGYNQAFSTDSLSLSAADSSIPIWLDDLACLPGGAYNCISECQACPSTVSTNLLCNSQIKDATVQCYEDTDENKLSQTFGDCQVTARVDAVEGSVVLRREGVDSPSHSSGLVVLYHKTDWGNICGQSTFSITEADVICHQMTYTGASSLSYGTDHSDSRSPVITDMDCSTGNELTVLQCGYSDTIPSSCNDDSDLAVTCYTSRIWDDPFPGMVRLVDGDYINEGRVEVYCSGQWGTVCGNAFDASDGGAVCRQLGYSNSVVNYATLPSSSDSPLWLDNPECSDGTSPMCISSCQYCPISEPTTSCQPSTVRCSHSDSAVSGGLNRACKVDSLLPGIAQSGAVLLGRNGTYSWSNSFGRVILYHHARWGTICRGNVFGQNGADVICHQLTYSGASSWSYAAKDDYGSDPLPVIFKVDSCSHGDYLTIFQCSLSTTITDDCISNSVSVTCYTSRLWDNPFDNMIRVSNGDYPNEGLLEVYCSGKWGTVCGESYEDSAARTTCRQLGYDSYSSYESSPQLRGNSSQEIWLDRLSCSDDSSCLTDCQSCPNSRTSQCEHEQDISIKCSTTIGSDNTFRTKSCLHITSYLIPIAAGTGGGVIVVIITIIIAICCFKIQRDKGRCPQPCGTWAPPVDDSNAGPLSLSMNQRHRRAPIVVPAFGKDEPPPYDLTNGPPLNTETNDQEEGGNERSNVLIKDEPPPYLHINAPPLNTETIASEDDQEGDTDER